MNSICCRNTSAIKGVRDEGQERSDGSPITIQNGPIGPPKLGVQANKTHPVLQPVIISHKHGRGVAASLHKVTKGYQQLTTIRG